jgi:pyruvate formate lyase activating enzyme
LEFTPETAVYKNKCVACGECRRADFKIEDCLGEAQVVYGVERTAEELLPALLEDRPFYESSGGGVTFSGGECMLQIDFLEELLIACKKSGIHTAVDTAGHVPWESFERILPHTDLFLYDIKCFDIKKHKHYTGAANKLVLENLKKLLSRAKSVWVRIPVIPTVNDTVEEMRQIKNFLEQHGTPARVELLPYHAMGEHKYDAIGRAAQPFSTPSKDSMNLLRCVFY